MEHSQSNHYLGMIPDQKKPSNHEAGMKAIKTMNSQVTIVIPALNEEKNLRYVISRLHEMNYDDILIVDGNSTDGTPNAAMEMGARVIIQDGNGKGDALRQALNGMNLLFQCRDVVVFMDADGSMDPSEVPMLVEALGSGADLAKGSRFLSGGYSEDITWLRRLGNKFFVHTVNLLWSAGYTDLCYGFVALRKNAVGQLCGYLTSKNFEIEAEIYIKAKRLGMNVVEVPSVEFRRRQGKSKLRSLRDGYRIFGTILREYFSGDQIKIFQNK